MNSLGPSTPTIPLTVAGAISKNMRNFDYKKQEGKHTRRHLKDIMYHSKMMHKLLKDADDLPDWVNSKVTLAADYIDSTSHYLKNRIEEMKLTKLSNKRSKRRTNRKKKYTRKIKH